MPVRKTNTKRTSTKKTSQKANESVKKKVPKKKPVIITENLSFSYRKDQKDIMVSEAKKENRSLSNYIQMVLDKHINNLSN